MNSQLQFNLIVSKLSWLPISALHIRLVFGIFIGNAMFLILYAIPLVRDVMFDYLDVLLAVMIGITWITVRFTTSERQCLESIDGLLASYQPLNVMALRQLQHRVREKGGYELDDLTTWLQAEMIAINNFNTQQNPVSSSFLDRKI